MASCAAIRLRASFAASASTSAEDEGAPLAVLARAIASMTRQVDIFAVVYDHEVLDSVPVEPHDMPLTGAVTQKRTLIF